MITPDILPVLRCPAGGDPLLLAEPELVERVNQAIAEGSVRDQLDVRVDDSIDAGLVPPNRDRLYPIRQDITTLIADNAIDLQELTS